MKKILIVCGFFNTEDGKESKKLKPFISCLEQEYKDLTILNGGNIKDLEINITPYKIIIWIPNIPNEVQIKYIENIKKQNPTCILVSSKVSRENFNINDFVGRMLNIKSNLGIFIEGNNFKIIDPLGNIFSNTNDFNKLAENLISRLNELLKFTRIKSKQSNINHNLNNNKEIKEFIKIIQKYGKKFNELVQSVNPNRLLGNASTRCSYGFPSFKQHNIYVTKRNVEKETLNIDDFIPVQLKNNTVIYDSQFKPSVDTPIQIKLYEYYNNIKYIIHGHAFLENTIFTDNIIPCGCIEEFDEIIKKYPNRNIQNFSINLRGHGCLVLGSDLNYFEKQRRAL
jgi:hypothetical protein